MSQKNILINHVQFKKHVLEKFQFASTFNLNRMPVLFSKNINYLLRKQKSFLSIKDAEDFILLIFENQITRTYEGSFFGYIYNARFC